MIKFKLVLLKHKTDANGLYPIYLRLTKEKKLKYINTGKRCKFNEWDNDSCQLNHNFKNFKICFIGVNISNNSGFKLVDSTDFYDVWSLTINNSFTGGLFNNNDDNENYIKIIKSYDLDQNRLSKDEIDNLNND